MRQKPLERPDLFVPAIWRGHLANADDIFAPRVDGLSDTNLTLYGSSLFMFDRDHRVTSPSQAANELAMLETHKDITAQTLAILRLSVDAPEEFFSAKQRRVLAKYVGQLARKAVSHVRRVAVQRPLPEYMPPERVAVSELYSFLPRDQRTQIDEIAFRDLEWDERTLGMIPPDRFGISTDRNDSQS